jgi:uncharacterized protein YcbX
MHLSGLFIYPVKSLRGIRLESASVDALGLIGDRRFLVVDPAGKFITQRTHPQLARIATTLSADRLTLDTAGHPPLAVARASDPTARLLSVTVWSSAGLRAEDCGEAAAAWFTAFLGTPCRLVRAGAAFDRPVAKPGKARPGDRVGFADAYPLLGLGEASVRDLNDRLVAAAEDAVPLDRFRPNLVFAGTAPFAEDTWSRFRIGPVVFRAGGPCARCIMTTTDQVTGERSHEPLRTLATYRRDTRDPTDVNFGQNLFIESASGPLRVGDAIEVLG